MSHRHPRPSLPFSLPHHFISSLICNQHAAIFHAAVPSAQPPWCNREFTVLWTGRIVSHCVGVCAMWDHVYHFHVYYHIQWFMWRKLRRAAHLKRANIQDVYCSLPCFSLLWGNLWHSLKLRWMQNGLTASPRSPLPSSDSYCMKDVKECDKRPGEKCSVCVSPLPHLHFLTAPFIDFLKYAQSAADGEDLVNSVRLVIL